MISLNWMYFARRLFGLTTLLLSIIMAGCSSNPLGIDDDHWDIMSSAQKLEAHKAQAEVEKEQQRAATARYQAELEAKTERQKLRESIRRNALYGDLIQCVLDPIYTYSSKKWKPLKGVSFELVRGESQALTLERVDINSDETVYALADISGQQVQICQNYSEAYGVSTCFGLHATTREMAYGVSRYFELKKELKGQLRCDLKPVGDQGYTRSPRIKNKPDPSWSKPSRRVPQG